MVLVVKNPPPKAGDMRDTGLIPGSGRSPGGGHGNALQYSCLENPMDRGAWRATGLWGHQELDTCEATQRTGMQRRRLGKTTEAQKTPPLRKDLTSRRLDSSNSHAEFTHGYFHMYSAFLIHNILSSIPFVFLSDSSLQDRQRLGTYSLDTGPCG